MKPRLPDFPPLLKGTRVPIGKSPFSRARSMAEKGRAGAGDILWSEERNTLNLAIVLEPEVSRDRCFEMVFLMMVAFGDAAGAISAPEIAIGYSWPSEIRLNDALIGHVDLLISERETNAVPDWAVLGLEVAIKPQAGNTDPGKQMDQTTMWDEGCGDISRTELLESVSRHFISWIHQWSEDGFKPVHQQWEGRLCEKHPFSHTVSKGTLTGIDEHGNALCRNEAGEMTTIHTEEALDGVRFARRVGK